MNSKGKEYKKDKEVLNTFFTSNQGQKISRDL